MLKDLHFHDHPRMEKDHRIPSDHVIIDRSAYVGVLELRNKESSEELSKVGGVIEDQTYNHPEPIIRLYPNKFKIITHESQATEPGLYYINEAISEDVIEPLYKWIDDLIKEKNLLMDGNHASIEEGDFHQKYDYPLGKFGRRHGVCGSKRDYYTSLRLNSIRIDSFLDSLPRIMLWGSYIKGINQKDLLSITLAHDFPTLEQMALIMSLIDIILVEGCQAMWNCLRPLKAMRWIYNGYQAPSQPQVLVLRFTPTIADYYINLENRDNLKKDIDFLKKYLIKE